MSTLDRDAKILLELELLGPPDATPQQLHQILSESEWEVTSELMFSVSASAPQDIRVSLTAEDRWQASLILDLNLTSLVDTDGTGNDTLDLLDFEPTLPNDWELVLSSYYPAD